MKKSKFISQLRSYFEVYLPNNRNCSEKTISAYSDSFKILFGYFSEKLGKPYYLVDYKDFTLSFFDEYVLYLKNEKAYKPASIKQRISAISSFMKYAGRREVSALGALSAVSETKTPKIPKTIVSHFSLEETRILLHTPSNKGSSGWRDTVLLSLLYDSGARAQELCNIRIEDIRFGETTKLKLFGKGNKTREIPLSGNVSKLLRTYVRNSRKGADRTSYLFTGQRSDRITPACIRHLVNKYVEIARRNNPELFYGTYTPHSFRHSKAVHMVEADIPLIYIRNFLGHESVKTTEVYARISQDKVIEILSGKNLSDIEAEDMSLKEEKLLPDFIK